MYPDMACMILWFHRKSLYYDVERETTIFFLKEIRTYARNN